MIDFVVRPDGGDAYRVTATARDILQWERTTKGASFAALMRDMRFTDLYKVAYYASRRLGHFTGSLAEFEASVDLVHDDDADDEPDPTQPAR